MALRFGRDGPHGAEAARGGDSIGAILRRTVTAAIVIGAFLSFVTAFGSGRIPLLPRTGFMLAVAVFASLAGVASFQLLARSAWLEARWWRLGAAAGLVICAPVAAFAWLGLQLVAPRPPPPRALLLDELPGSLVTSLFFCLWAAHGRARRRAPARPQAPEAVAPPRFFERLPPKLRGAELWAIEAEDHYLRLHTSCGQDLILMRLTDALAELEGLDGARTHRSWWVARAAVTRVERGDGRATLTLKNGVAAPVSRTHARALRARGWL